MESNPAPTEIDSIVAHEAERTKKVWLLVSIARSKSKTDVSRRKSRPSTDLRRQAFTCAGVGRRRGNFAAPLQRAMTALGGSELTILPTRHLHVRHLICFTPLPFPQFGPYGPTNCCFRSLLVHIFALVACPITPLSACTPCTTILLFAKRPPHRRIYPPLTFDLAPLEFVLYTAAPHASRQSPQRAEHVRHGQSGGTYSTLEPRLWHLYKKGAPTTAFLASGPPPATMCGLGKLPSACTSNDIQSPQFARWLTRRTAWKFPHRAQL